MKRESILITGANGGLGFETTKLLAKAGIKNIVMAGRSWERIEEAQEKLLSEVTTQTKIAAAGGFDMTDHEAIENAVLALDPRTKFDVVFLQAGGVVFKDDYQYVTHSGQQVERTVYQNAIGGYLLLVNLMKHDLLAENARIVFAGGEGARGIPGMIAKPEFKSAKAFLNYVKGTGIQPIYDPMNAIGVSKLTSALIVQKMAALNDGNEYIWFTPGLTHGTNGLAAVSPAKRFFMEKVMFGISGALGFSQSPEKGAQKYVDSLLGNVGKNGDVLGAPEGKVLGAITNQKPMNSSLSDQEMIDGFWNFLQELYPLPILETQTI